MFKIALPFVILLSCQCAIAQPVPIEPDAVISGANEMQRSQLPSLIESAVGLIRSHGWKCDSISSVRPFRMSPGIAVICNQYNYTYELWDQGGNWLIALK